MYKNGIILTGPIGSGKSEALDVVNKLGYETVDLDTVSYTHLTLPTNREV